jgi:hypothetical protein
VVSELLGHISTEVTQKYAHVIPSASKNVVEEVFGEKEGPKAQSPRAFDPIYHDKLISGLFRIVRVIPYASRIGFSVEIWQAQR